MSERLEGTYTRRYGATPETISDVLTYYSIQLSTEESATCCGHAPCSCTERVRPEAGGEEGAG